MNELDTPAALRDALRELAGNLWFSWIPGAREVFARLDPERFAALDHNPTALLAELSDDTLWERTPRDLLGRARHELAAERARRTWWARRSEDTGLLVAYFSCEFGLDESLPIYSGGLGVLSGDHLKSASDLGLPLVGVGLFYRNGYFRQHLDESGWQTERYPENDPRRLPLHAESVSATVPLAASDGTLHDVRVRVWRAQVGRIALYLLDTDVDGNPDWARTITDALYGGDRQHRIRQELVLGVGGVRVLRALGLEPTVFHMNEGHSAFLQLERLRELIEDEHVAREAALQRLRASTVFTTHTPVPAGNEIFDAWLVQRNLQGLVERCGFTWDEFVAMGRTSPVESGFGLTPFALRTSTYANGVSELHGEVSREMWQALWPERSVDDVPIGHVTNGVHLPTWLGGPMRALLDRHLGDGWLDRADDPATWEPIDDVDDAELWAVRNEQRAELAAWARERSVADRLGRDEPREYAEAPGFGPDVLTIGFARRLATYKRLHLLLRSADRIADLLGGERSIQILLAGKAHPKDEEAKHTLQALFSRKGIPQIGRSVAYIEDYDLSIGARLTRGCDVWMNVPRPPLEASGTSGMKSAVNGGLQLSVLDGWWAEAYDGTNGWALSGKVDDDHDAQDARDADELLRLLRDEVVPEFYDRDADGLPRAWLARTKASLRTNGPAFSASRMLRDYVDRIYAEPTRV
jgi:glycogen phosphorylase